MILCTLLLTGLLCAQLEQPPAFAVTARLSPEGVDPEADALPRGRELRAVLEFDFEGEISQAFRNTAAFDPALARRPLVFLDVPEGVRLSGTAPAQLVTPGDFQQSYLRFPFGRRVFDKRTEIPFRILRSPPDDATLGLNVVWWSGRDEAATGSFERVRLELSLRPGAVATPGDATNSRWGAHDTLAIGDTLPAFEAPLPNGELLDLADLIGEQRLLVMVFRRET